MQQVMLKEWFSQACFLNKNSKKQLLQDVTAATAATAQENATWSVHFTTVYCKNSCYLLQSTTNCIRLT